MATTTAPGPVYDNSLRLLARRDLVRVCAWLDVQTHETAIHRAESLPTATHYVDLMAQVGPGHLAHVEFVRSPDQGTAHRMLEYRARIMTLHPGHRITQHVVVLARGTVPQEVTDPPQLTLRLHVRYVRDEDPERLLASASLAPLAVLARAGDLQERTRTLRRALALIAAVPDAAHRHDLLHTSVTLAAIHLDAATIEHLTQEAGMPFTLDEDTVGGRSLIARERTQTLAALMRRAFGDDSRVEALAERLAHLPRERALDAALKAPTLEDLATLIDSEPSDETAAEHPTEP